MTASTRQRTTSATDRVSGATTKTLATLLAAHAPHDGRFPLTLPGTYAIRLSKIAKEMTRVTVQPMVCIVAQVPSSVRMRV